jgi:hypothetical protein
VPDVGEKIANDQLWISTGKARAILQITNSQMRHLMDLGAVRIRRLPGLHPQVLQSDVERLARESVQPIGASA